MFKFFIERINQNEATLYYINIVKRSLELSGENVVVTTSLKDITPDDKVFVVSLKTFFYVWLKNRKQYIITWFQGVSPEEAMYDDNHGFIFKICRKVLLTLVERTALHHSKINLFVSKAMYEHYHAKYKYTNTNYFVMPCFNQELNTKYIKPERYEKPTFVYAGSLSKWQCIDETLLLYKKINNLYPNSSLTILTKEKEKAKTLCEKYNVSADIKFIPLENLQNELKNYKYGFIVRKDIVVNNVATPTKMNSYIASGIIPIFSNVIYDFRDIFNNAKYIIPFSSDDECLKKIQILEKSIIPIKDITKEYTDIFNCYYSSQKYIQQLNLFFKQNV